VGCSHTAGCPLFPLLKASLQGWRDYYCDSEDQWRGCARYQVSLTGERVPISLLPNGARARHLEDAAGHPDQSGTAHQEQRPQQAQAPQQNPWSAESASWSQPTSGAPAWFGAASPPIPDSHDELSPRPQVPPSSGRPSRHARQAPSPKRGWWARFTEWMGGPA